MKVPQTQNSGTGCQAQVSIDGLRPCDFTIPNFPDYDDSCGGEKARTPVLVCSGVRMERLVIVVMSRGWVCSLRRGVRDLGQRRELVHRGPAAMYYLLVATFVVAPDQQ